MVDEDHARTVRPAARRSRRATHILPLRPDGESKRFTEVFPVAHPVNLPALDRLSNRRAGEIGGWLQKRTLFDGSDFTGADRSGTFCGLGRPNRGKEGEWNWRTRIEAHQGGRHGGGGGAVGDGRLPAWLGDP